MKIQTIKKTLTSFTSIALALLLVMLFPINAFAAELPQVDKTRSTVISDKASEVSVLRTIITVDKEIKMFYSNADSIPTSISYREYNYGGWLSGILFLRSAREVQNGWEATFSGKITGSV